MQQHESSYVKKQDFKDALLYKTILCMKGKNTDEENNDCSC